MIFKYIFPFTACRFVCLKIFSPFFCTGHLWLVISRKRKISHQTVMEMLPITINLHLWMSRGRKNTPRTFRHLGHWCFIKWRLNQYEITRTCLTFYLPLLSSNIQGTKVWIRMWSPLNKTQHISQLLCFQDTTKDFIIGFVEQKSRWEQCATWKSYNLEPRNFFSILSRMKQFTDGIDWLLIHHENIIEWGSCWCFDN